MPDTVSHSIYVLASILTEALGKRRRGDLAQAQLDAMDALRRLHDAQRAAWRAELGSTRARLSQIVAQLDDLRSVVMDLREGARVDHKSIESLSLALGAALKRNAFEEESREGE